jgi:hypothetical protein
VKPSCSGHARKVPIKGDDGEDKKVLLSIPEAEIASCGSGMWLDPKKVTIPVTDQRELSSLPSKFNSATDGKHTYVNEFGVQAFCQRLITDALYALGLDADVMSHLEISIYTMKPDIMLVLQRQGLIVFVVEVKSPEANGNEVFTSNAVAGQVWSYLYAMRASGVEVPMGAIMTFKKMVLVTLDDYSSDEDHLAKVKKTGKTYRQGGVTV